MPVLSEPVACDLDDSHVATIHCPACEEYFCDACDVIIHERKKNKGHTRDGIEIVEPVPEPVPCDSNNQHVAVMYCEDCEENFCHECDFTFHSRKKTANHARFEGARRPEDVEILKKEAEAEALAAQLAAQKVQGKALGASYASAAAAGVKSAPATASPAKPAPGKGLAAGAPTSAAATAAAASSAAAAADKPKTAVAAAAASGAQAGETPATAQTGAERAKEFRAAWDAKRKQLCKEQFNGHWLGLTTDERKDLSVLLCRELLFNPEPSNVKGNRLAVEWAVQSYWTTYSIAVQCTTVSGSAKKGKQTVTHYKVAVDDMGRLESFDVEVDGVAQGGNCSIQ